MNRKKKKGWAFIAMIAATVFVVMVGFLGNTIAFERMLRSIIEQYVSENNYELASHISYRLKSGQEFVRDFADSLSRMPDFLLTEDLMGRKKDIMVVDDISVVSREGEFFPEFTKTPELETWIFEHSEVWDEPQISYIKDYRMLFSAPVIKNGETVSLVIGEQSYQGIQQLVSQADYQDQGISILLEQKSRKRIVANKGRNAAITDEEIAELWDCIAKRELSVGIYEKQLLSGRRFFISTYQIEGTDWVQVAAIPSDFLMRQLEPYINIYFISTVTVVFLCVLSMVYLLRESRKKELLFLKDSLTGGWNRDGFLKQSREIIDNRNFSDYTVVYLNVVDFRIINESWGEDDGNRTLQFIFQQFEQEMTKKGEMISRSSMDHFFLLLRETEEAETNRRLDMVIKRMNDSVSDKFFGTSINFTIGACRMKDADSISSAMTRAISASKQKGARNVCIFYDNEVAARQEREQRLNELFEESVRNRDLRIYLQPKVSTIPGKPCQAEALVRWIHPVEGMIYPDEFIPLFEKNGNICQLDLYMFEEVCRLIAGWIRDGKEVSLLSVNLSRFHLRSKGVDSWKEYKEIKERYQIPDGLIEIELTETVFIDDSQLSFVKLVLDRFRACGFRVALDDFGFAYSSLGILNELEVDTLKLDRSFFINENMKTREIIASLIRLAHNLKLCVVAEGIEQMEQVEMLRDMHCDLIQGYVYSKPIPAEEFEGWREAYENQQY